MKLKGKKAKEAWSDFYKEQKFFLLLGLSYEAVNVFGDVVLVEADVLHPSRKGKAGNPKHTLYFKHEYFEFTIKCYDEKIEILDSDNTSTRFSFFEIIDTPMTDSSLSNMKEMCHHFSIFCSEM